MELLEMLHVMTIGSRVKNYTSWATGVGEITQGQGRGESAMLKVTPGMWISKEALHKRPKVKSSLGCIQVFIYVVHM